MKPSVTIMSIADIELFETGIGREGRMAVKQFPLETGVPGVDMEFSWNAYDKGYGTPRHKHTTQTRADASSQDSHFDR